MTAIDDLAPVVDLTLDANAAHQPIEESLTDVVCPRCEEAGPVAGSVQHRIWVCGSCAARGRLVPAGR